MGPTPTPTRTLGMRLSWNFVNGYTIAYCVQHTFTRVHARIPNARKSPRVGQVGGQVGKDCRACPARGKLNGEVAGHADFRASVEFADDVSVGVGPMEFKLYCSFDLWSRVPMCVCGRPSDDVIVTPFAQILHSLRSVRHNYLSITGLPPDRWGTPTATRPSSCVVSGGVNWQ